MSQTIAGETTVEECLSTLNSNLTDVFITRNATSTTESVPGNTTAGFNIALPTVAGYTPIAFQSIAVNSSNSKLVEFQIRNSTYCSIVGYNTNPNTVDIYYSVKILYAKTSMVGS